MSEMIDGYEAMRESINYQADTLDPTLMNLLVARQAVYRLRARLAESERERDAARRELAEVRKDVYLEVSACYFPKTSDAELTWKDIETGRQCEITVPMTPKQGESLVEVIGPCVYYKALSRPASKTD